LKYRERGSIEKIILARKNTEAAAEARGTFGIQTMLPGILPNLQNLIKGCFGLDRITQVQTGQDIKFIFFMCETTVDESQTFP